MAVSAAGCGGSWWRTWWGCVGGRRAWRLPRHLARTAALLVGRSRRSTLLAAVGGGKDGVAVAAVGVGVLPLPAAVAAGGGTVGGRRWLLVLAVFAADCRGGCRWSWCRGVLRPFGLAAAEGGRGGSVVAAAGLSGCRCQLRGRAVAVLVGRSWQPSGLASAGGRRGELVVAAGGYCCCCSRLWCRATAVLAQACWRSSALEAADCGVDGGWWQWSPLAAAIAACEIGRRRCWRGSVGG